MTITPPKKKLLTELNIYGSIIFDTNDDSYYFKDGPKCHHGIITRLIGKGAIKPTGDGLLDNHSQTYIANTTANKDKDNK